MNPCRIAVGSTRRPKLQAVQEAAASFGAKLTPHAPLEIQGYEVESGVSHTPSSREELMQGARQRAEALHKMLADSGQRADYCLGLEGGLDVATENGTRRVFLESWAYVTDGVQGHFGCSGSIEIPELLAELGSLLRPVREFVELNVPHQESAVIARLHAQAQVVERNYDGETARFKARIPPHLHREFSAFIVPEVNGHPAK